MGNQFEESVQLLGLAREDGVHWNKPQLGLREFCGSKDNNFCALNRECYKC